MLMLEERVAWHCLELQLLEGLTAVDAAYLAAEEELEWDQLQAQYECCTLSCISSESRRMSLSLTTIADMSRGGSFETDIIDDSDFLDKCPNPTVRTPMHLVRDRGTAPPPPFNTPLRVDRMSGVFSIPSLPPKRSKSRGWHTHRTRRDTGLDNRTQ